MPDESKRWYLLIGGEREGPLSTEDVKYLLTQKKVFGGTLLYHKGMDSWERLREVEEFHPRPRSEPEAEAEPEPAKSEPPPEAEPESDEKIQSEETTSGRSPTPPSGPSHPPTERSSILWKIILASIIFALGAATTYYTIIRDESGRGLSQDVQEVVEQLRSGNQKRAQKALEGGPPGAIVELLEAIDRKEVKISSQRVRKLLVGIGLASLSTLEKLMNGDLGVPVRILIVRVFGDIGGEQAVASLAQALEQPDEKVRSAAHEALENLGPEAVPDMIQQLQSPIADLSPGAKKKLTEAIEMNADPSVSQDLRQAQVMESDPEVKAAISKVLEKLSAAENSGGLQGRAETPEPSKPVGPATGGVEGRQLAGPQAAPQQPVRIEVHASAEAKVTIEKPEDAPEKAAELADKGTQLREEGNREEALEAYREAYLLNPLEGYLLIIIELEGAVNESDKLDEGLDLPSPPVSLREIHEALKASEPDLGGYQNALGFWEGTLDGAVPIKQEAGREQFLVQGKAGEDFVVSVPLRLRISPVWSPDHAGVWRGTLKGFTITDAGDKARILPVLEVDSLE